MSTRVRRRGSRSFPGLTCCRCSAPTVRRLCGHRRAVMATPRSASSRTSSRRRMTKFLLESGIVVVCVASFVGTYVLGAPDRDLDRTAGPFDANPAAFDQSQPKGVFPTQKIVLRIEDRSLLGPLRLDRADADTRLLRGVEPLGDPVGECDLEGF